MRPFLGCAGGSVIEISDAIKRYPKASLKQGQFS